MDESPLTWHCRDAQNECMAVYSSTPISSKLKGDIGRWFNSRVARDDEWTGQSLHGFLRPIYGLPPIALWQGDCTIANVIRYTQGLINYPKPQADAEEKGPIDLKLLQRFPGLDHDVVRVIEQDIRRTIYPQNPATDTSRVHLMELIATLDNGLFSPGSRTFPNGDAVLDYGRSQGYTVDKWGGAVVAVAHWFTRAVQGAAGLAKQINPKDFQHTDYEKLEKRIMDTIDRSKSRPTALKKISTRLLVAALLITAITNTVPLPLATLISSFTDRYNEISWGYWDSMPICHDCGSKTFGHGVCSSCGSKDLQPTVVRYGYTGLTWITPPKFVQFKDTTVAQKILANHTDADGYTIVLPESD